MEGPELTVFVQLLKRKVDGGHLYPSLIEVLDSCDKDVFSQHEQFTACFNHIAGYKLFCGALVFNSEPNQIQQQSNHAHRKTKQPLVADV